MAREHPLKPFYSVLVLAFACSALVAVAAVGLRPFQEANRSLDQKKNILAAAGIYDPEKPVAEQFGVIETKLVDLDTGRFVDPPGVDPGSYRQLEAALSDKTGERIPPEQDIAGIRRLEDYSLVYLVRQGDGIDQVVLPVRGKGLWSTMYAYVAVAADLKTITGVAFYEHGETPGLGGEVANPRWEARWEGKKLYDPEGRYELDVVKSGTQVSADREQYTIDGLSGATLTTKGVDHLMQFWFGEHGFKPFFEQHPGGLNG